MSETRPDLHNIHPEQRQLGLAHWHLWVVLQEHPSWHVDGAPILQSLEMEMQPETLHQLALARGRYLRE
jgi:hypothetical protein